MDLNQHPSLLEHHLYLFDLSLSVYAVEVLGVFVATAQPHLLMASEFTVIPESDNSFVVKPALMSQNPPLRIV